MWVWCVNDLYPTHHEKLIACACHKQAEEEKEKAWEKGNKLYWSRQISPGRSSSLGTRSWLCFEGAFQHQVKRKQLDASWFIMYTWEELFRSGSRYNSTPQAFKTIFFINAIHGDIDYYEVMLENTPLGCIADTSPMSSARTETIFHIAHGYLVPLKALKFTHSSKKQGFHCCIVVE